jgi:hypothetical protein
MSLDLLPQERLIAELRNDEPATELAEATDLRRAAAEIVREGYLLHYAEPRWYDIEDRDLALLAGDRMYAAGLDVLAEAGDNEAVGMLARLIAGCAEAHASDESAHADNLWQSTLAMLAPVSDDSSLN